MEDRSAIAGLGQRGADPAPTELEIIQALVPVEVNPVALLAGDDRHTGFDQVEGDGG